MKSKNIKTFEEFSGFVAGEQTNEFKIANLLGLSTKSQKIERVLNHLFDKYVNDATGGEYKNPVEGATPEDYKKAFDMLKEVDFNIKKMTGEQKYIDMAKYLIKRAEASISMTARTGHEFGTSPKL